MGILYDDGIVRLDISQRLAYYMISINTFLRSDFRLVEEESNSWDVHKKFNITDFLRTTQHYKHRQKIFCEVQPLPSQSYREHKSRMKIFKPSIEEEINESAVEVLTKYEELRNNSKFLQDVSLHTINRLYKIISHNSNLLSYVKEQEDIQRSGCAYEPLFSNDELAAWFQNI